MAQKQTIKPIMAGAFLLVMVAVGSAVVFSHASDASPVGPGLISDPSFSHSASLIPGSSAGAGSKVYAYPQSQAWAWFQFNQGNTECGVNGFWWPYSVHSLDTHYCGKNQYEYQLKANQSLCLTSDGDNDYWLQPCTGNDNQLFLHDGSNNYWVIASRTNSAGARRVLCDRYGELLPLISTNPTGCPNNGQEWIFDD
jgi:hypothetical protein